MQHALTRIIASPTFRATTRRKRLLRFLVEETVAGRAGRLKPYAVAVDGLGCDETFDPQADPIVRIEVGRLRRDLEHYYLTDGRDDPLRISVPKGGCVPAFERWEPPPEAVSRDTPSSPPLRRRRLAVGAVGAGLLLVLGLAGASWSSIREGGDPLSRPARETEPAVLVIPFEASGDEGDRLLASGLADELIATLMRFDALRVFAGVVPGRSGAEEVPPAVAGNRVYVLAGRVKRAPDRLRVTARLTDYASKEVLWSEGYDRPLSTADILDLEAELSTVIAGRLAQPAGVIPEAAIRGTDRGRPESLTAYDCVQRALAFRRSFGREPYPPVRSCLEEAVRRDPGYADAWAMLAFAHLDAARFGFVEASAQAGEMAAGLDAALRAVELAPNRVRPLQSLAALRFIGGDYDEAERVQRGAIALNPDDPESLAQLGWRLMARGRWDDGRRNLQAAIDRSVRVPSWYYDCLALALYLAGDAERALEAARLSKEDCCGIASVTLAITEAAAGHPVEARAALDEALRKAPVLRRDPRAFWANHRASEAVIDRLIAGLALAGLEAARQGAQASASP